jgi:division protein CdvB (Snf7/Vps24/ESCRT-III family)
MLEGYAVTERLLTSNQQPQHERTETMGTPIKKMIVKLEKEIDHCDCQAEMLAITIHDVRKKQDRLRSAKLRLQKQQVDV